MATDPRKRQRKLERRAAKRKEKKHELVRGLQAAVRERLRLAARYPVLHAMITEDLWTQGLGWVLLSRELPDGTVAAALFLVDRYCLGVKNVLTDFLTRFTYEREYVRKMKVTFSSREVTPAAVRKLVEGAVAYARNLGFPPHADYDNAKLLFGDINPNECTDEFEFGKDGKPLYITGPNDTPTRCRHILEVLARSCRAGHFDYLMPAGDLDRLLPDALKKEQVRLIGPDEQGGYIDEKIDLDSRSDEP